MVRLPARCPARKPQKQRPVIAIINFFPIEDKRVLASQVIFPSVVCSLISCRFAPGFALGYAVASQVQGSRFKGFPLKAGLTV
jgi:hypothetical protein